MFLQFGTNLNVTLKAEGIGVRRKLKNCDIFNFWQNVWDAPDFEIWKKMYNTLASVVKLWNRTGQIFKAN